METIAACVPIYGATALTPYVTELFDALKIEIFHATDSALEDAALAAMHRIVATLSAGISITAVGDQTEKALKPLITECMINLKEPEAKNLKPAGRILRAAASASGMAFTDSLMWPQTLADTNELLSAYRLRHRSGL